MVWVLKMTKRESKFSLEWNSMGGCSGTEELDSFDELMARISSIVKKYKTDGELKMSILEY